MAKKAHFVRLHVKVFISILLSREILRLHDFSDVLFPPRSIIFNVKIILASLYTGQKFKFPIATPCVQEMYMAGHGARDHNYFLYRIYFSKSCNNYEISCMTV